MYKLILTGTVTSDPEKYYSLDKDKYFLVFKFKCFIDSKLDNDEIEIICKDKFFNVAENHITKGTNLIIEGSPSTQARRYNKNDVFGVIKVTVTSLQFLDSELYIDNSDSNNLFELLEALHHQLQE